MIPVPESDPDAPLTPSFLVMLTIVAGFVQLAFLTTFQGAGAGAMPALVGMGAIVGFGVAIYLASSHIPEPPAFHLGLVPPPRTAWTAVLFLAFSVLLISEVDNVFKQVFPLPEELTDAVPRPEGAMYAFSLTLLLIVIQPATEEIFFRGLVQPRFVEKHGIGRGLVLTSLLNGLALSLALLNPWSFASVFSMSLVLGVLRQSSHSILPGLVLHALFGTAALLASFEAFGIEGFDDLSAAHTPLGWLAPAFLLSGIGFGLCRSAADAPSPPSAPPSPGGEEPHL